MRTRPARLLRILTIVAAISCASCTPTAPSPVSGGLWLGVQPPGTNGHAVLGDNWQVQTIKSFSGGTFSSPTLEEVRIFDLLDKGFDPQGAIDWMNSNGYPTSAAYYPSTKVIGFPLEYMALIDGRWDLVVRIGA